MFWNFGGWTLGTETLGTETIGTATIGTETLVVEPLEVETLGFESLRVKLSLKNQSKNTLKDFFSKKHDFFLQFKWAILKQFTS